MTAKQIHKTFHIGDLHITEQPRNHEKVELQIGPSACYLTKAQFQALANLAEYHSYSDSITWYTPEEQAEKEGPAPCLGELLSES